MFFQLKSGWQKSTQVGTDLNKSLNFSICSGILFEARIFVKYIFFHGTSLKENKYFVNSSLQGSGWHPIRWMLLYVRYFAKILRSVANVFRRYNEQKLLFSLKLTPFLQHAFPPKRGNKSPHSRVYAYFDLIM